jgi:hypothetical protein
MNNEQRTSPPAPQGGERTRTKINEQRTMKNEKTHKITACFCQNGRENDIAKNVLSIWQAKRKLQLQF